MTAAPDGLATARAMVAFLEADAAIEVGGWSRTLDSGTVLVHTSAPIPSGNGVFRVDGEPTADEIRAYAADAGESPWCVFARTEPSAELRAAAAEVGLTACGSAPTMVRTIGAPERVPDGVTVRVTRASGRTAYVAALAAGYDAPVDFFDALMTDELMDAPDVTGLLVEADGVVVATAMAAVAGGMVGVYNIATPPAHRRRGWGRVATEAAIAVGREAGVGAAWLVSSEMGASLYRSMGFETVETWSYVTAP